MIVKALYISKPASIVAGQGIWKRIELCKLHAAWDNIKIDQRTPFYVDVSLLFKD